VQPIFPAEIVGIRPTQVEVRVAINAIGKVTKVTPVGGIANFELMVAITKAAQFWQFEPARLHGQPVPNEVNLIFHF
jgi:TonB family protein